MSDSPEIPRQLLYDGGSGELVAYITDVTAAQLPITQGVVEDDGISYVTYHLTSDTPGTVVDSGDLDESNVIFDTPVTKDGRTWNFVWRPPQDEIAGDGETTQFVVTIVTASGSIPVMGEITTIPAGG